MKDTFSDEVGTAASQFGMGGDLVTSNASRYASQTDITSDTQLLESPRASTCLAALIQTALKQDFAGSGVTEPAWV